jgi:uncharacterized protein
VSSISQNKKHSYSSIDKIEAKESYYLYIKKSQINGSGNGLYTSIPIYKDEIISIFKGEILSDKQSQSRAKKGEDCFFINMPDGTILDCKNVKCYAKYANDASGIVKSMFKTNSHITLDENDNVSIVADRNIKAGEEIFCSYGKRYWKNYLTKL